MSAEDKSATIQEGGAISETNIGSARKGQYHPTDTAIVDLVANAIQVRWKRPYGYSSGRDDIAKKDLYLLDPSCGKGAALARLAAKVDAKTESGVMTFGNEIARTRYQDACKRLDVVTHGAQETFEAPRSFDIVWMNPPYDRGAKRRYEIEHVEQALSWVSRWGILVLVLPKSALDAEWWYEFTKKFKLHNVYSAPESIDDRWNQYIIFAQPEITRSFMLDRTANAYMEMYGQAVPLNLNARIPLELYTGARRTAPDISNDMPGSDVLVQALENATSFDQTESWQRHTTLPPVFNGGSPAMPCRAGHVVQLAAAGMTTGQRLTIDGHTYLMAGSSRKYIEKQIEKDGDDEIEHLIERTAYTITGFNLETGQYLMIDSKDTPDRYEQFLLEHTESLMDAVDRTNPPSYNWDYGHLIPTFDKIHSPHKLPGREEDGLLTAQKHVTAAMLGVLSKRKSGIIVGQMGTGKTITSMSTMAIQAGWFEGQTTKIVVMCPAPVVSKWAREARTILSDVPNFQAFEIGKRRKQPHTHPFQGDDLKHNLTIIEYRSIEAKLRNSVPLTPHEKARWYGTTASTVTLHAVRRGWPRPPHQWAAPEWRGLQAMCKVVESHRKKDIKKAKAAGYIVIPAFATRDLKRSKPILDAQRAMAHDGPAMLVMSFQDGKAGAPWEHAVHARRRTVTFTKRVEVRNSYTSQCSYVDKRVTETGTVYYCPECGQMLRNHKTGQPWTMGNSKDDQLCTRSTYSVARHCNANITKKVLVGKGEDGDPKYDTRAIGRCNAPLFEFQPFSYGGRFPVCEYLSQHYGGGYYAIIDEAHNTKGGDTNIGAASMDLIAGARNIIAMTGTILNGYARSLFYLQYRLFDSFRQMYEYSDVERYVSELGFMETVIKRSKGATRTSAHGGYTSESSYTREFPGVTPGVVAQLVEATCFLTLADIQMDLPPRDEFMTPVKMSKELEIGYQSLRSAESQAKMMFRNGNRGPLSRWLQASLGWADCPKAEEIKDLCALPAVTPKAPDGMFPKERQIVQLVVDNVSRGRGVIIHFQQVQSRDARERYRTLLKDAGIHTDILKRGSARPADRMDWVREHIINPAEERGQPPVLLANMQLLKEGVDLIEFATMILVAPHYNITELRQILARIHRLGQTKPVELYFPAYVDTRQEDATYHIARKMRAAAQVRGESAVGLAAVGMSKDNFINSLIERGEEVRGDDIAKMMGVRVMKPDSATHIDDACKDSSKPMNIVMKDPEPEEEPEIHMAAVVPAGSGKLVQATLF